VSGTSALTLWIHGVGHPAEAVVASVREAVAQAGSAGHGVTGIVCVVDPDAVARVAPIATAASIPCRVVDASRGADESAVANELLAAATGDWLVWIEATSVLAPGALEAIRSVVGRFAVDLLYGDSDLVDGATVRRPDVSPLRLRSQDYLGDLRAFRIARIRELGGFRSEANGAQAYDLTLRLGLEAHSAVHVPAVLAVSADVRRVMTIADQHAVERALAADGVAGTVERNDEFSFRVRYPVAGHPLVSIIIPTGGTATAIRGVRRVLVVDAVRGILERSTYPSLEIVVVADDSTPQSVIDHLLAIGGDRLRLVRWSDPFNFSAKMNRGAVPASGEYLLMLNDDVELITPDWIETMLGLAQQPGVGLVGPLLYFEDGSIQHGGHQYSGGWAGHIAFGWDADRDDALGSMTVDREVSGVTAACSLVSADTFWAIGGFSRAYAGNYNDVDFALKVRASGLTAVWTPHARLFHFESKSRVATVVPSELGILRRHWATRLLADPYWP
jgi:GT2 family glycosyltransferase